MQRLDTIYNTIYGKTTANYSLRVCRCFAYRFGESLVAVNFYFSSGSMLTYFVPAMFRWRFQPSVLIAEPKWLRIAKNVNLTPKSTMRRSLLTNTSSECVNWQQMLGSWCLDSSYSIYTVCDHELFGWTEKQPARRCSRHRLSSALHQQSALIKTGCSRPPTYNFN